jgi:sugar phosphate isomerase/epimerase
MTVTTGKVVFSPKPWEAYMHLGIVHFMLFPETMGGDGPVVETATKIATDDFFRVIEVRTVNDPEERAKLKTLCDMAHLEIGVGGQPLLLRNKLNLANLDEAGRKAAVEITKTAIDQAYFFGARIMATLDGPGSYPGEEKKVAATERLAESLKELCTYAKAKATDYTLFISLETFDQAIDKRSLIGPSKDAEKLAATVKKSCSNFGLTVDLSHMPLLFEKPIECLKPVKDHLIHAHAGNAYMKDKTNPAYGDQHPRFGVAGGENDTDELVEYLRALFEIGYFDKKLPTKMPVFTFEVKPLPGESPRILVANTKRVFKEAWAKV